MADSAKIVYEDKNIIVAWKPGGLATQTARVGQPDLVSELQKMLALREKDRTGSGAVTAKGQKKASELYVIHRLDQPVEGLLVFAKTKKAAAELNRQLSSGELKKEYLAVLCGQPKAENGELVDYLLAEKGNIARAVTGSEKEYPEAKRAVLQYHVLESIAAPLAGAKGIAEESAPGEASCSVESLDPACLTLAAIHIDTGRFHQIRCQMAHAGLPLLGDRKYADEEAQELACRLRISNVALCAHAISVRCPETKKELSFRVAPKNSAFHHFSENNFSRDCLY